MSEEQLRQEQEKALLEEITCTRYLLRDIKDNVVTIRKWVAFWAGVLFLVVFGPIILVVGVILLTGTLETLIKMITG